MDKPNYETDVNEIKSGFNMWERTYSYRGIKYNIAMSQREHSRWTVVDHPEETCDIVKLVGSANMMPYFLSCRRYPAAGESTEYMFYEAVEHAEKCIDWFLDECLDDIVHEIVYYNRLYDKVSSAIDVVNDGKE